MNTTEDPETEAAAVMIEDLLRLLPPDKRATALAIAVAAENAKSEERRKLGGRLRYLDITADFTKSLRFRHATDIKQLKAKIVYTFTRDITIDHSPGAAARLLFGEHDQVPGSGLLLDYIGDLIPDRLATK